MNLNKDPFYCIINHRKSFLSSFIRIHEKVKVKGGSLKTSAKINFPTPQICLLKSQQPPMQCKSTDWSESRMTLSYSSFTTVE